MNKNLMEFIGTFFLVLTIGLSGNALAIGAVLMAMVYMGGHVSGAHYNPAVTLAVWIRQKIDARVALSYIISQLLGGLAAALIIWWTRGDTFPVTPAYEASSLSVIMLELLFTFALCFVVLNVATHPATAGNQYYGLAIGLTVMAGAFAVGGITGGAFNPAVGISPNLVHAVNGGSIGHIWLYIIGPLGGAVLAGLLYKAMNPGEFSV